MVSKIANYCNNAIISSISDIIIIIILKIMIFSPLYIVGQLSIQSSTEEIPEQFAELVKSGGLYIILTVV